MVLKRTYFLVLALVLVLTVAALAVAACGSDDTTATTASVTDSTEAEATSGTLVVKGMVDMPATFTVADLQKMSPVTITAAHPKKGDTQYTGVKLADLFKTVGVQDAAATLVASSSDGYMAEIALTDIAASADAMLAIGEDGTLNMVLPGITGKAWAGDVIGWTFK